MKKVKHRYSTSKILGLSLALLLAFSTTVFSQEATSEDAASTEQAATSGTDAAGDPANGKKLFNSNCAACHALDKRMTGPALRGVGDKHDKEWLYSWIHNSSALIKAGDADAVAIYEEFNQTQMTAFPQLSEADIDDIIAYTMQPKAEPKQTASTDGGSGSSDGGNSGGINTNIVLGALALGFALMIVMLYVVNQTLRRIAEANGIALSEEKEKRLPIWKAFVQNQFLVIVSVIFLLLVSAYFAYGYFMQVGVDKGYQPVQPIHFSHRIHAGDNGIDCKYCHSSARVSKTSGIPSLNICMNCHKNISEVAEETGTEKHPKEFYDAQIQKLYKAVGWDASTMTYTGETESVKWVRIHNLPDFAYFNHSQHVTVAGVMCQECHGPVEEMEVLEQYAPLTMGWCINCHRETNVKMDGNEYYEEYYGKIHDQLAKKYGKDELTIGDLGGLECGKCHY
ncbi:Cytochrome c2 [Pustulibacterium marinum]|uniref:Cytochrome c2 n=1 Tax=Pustulibacterium marinum TaxID=1224947 RepID=A0A1I7HAK2_9FLAO|nr:c-type cytochrome [Pustulibacterium marinum]SFU57723.1 Cytochrome c2 [Pustulibacterium marinum]